ncbi:MAG TPA: hypothetical protein VFU68_00395, partial [Terracidiphilus sp.]|nr:hypothetical protein [Terracidiphilus sp.]
HDIEDLFGRVRVGDRVVFIPQRDEETAEIFGDGLAPLAPARQPVLLVQTEPLLASATQRSQLAQADAGPVAPGHDPAGDSTEAKTAENAGLMAKNVPAPAAGLSAAGSW